MEKLKTKCGNNCDWSKNKTSTTSSTTECRAVRAKGSVIIVQMSDLKIYNLLVIAHIAMYLL